MSHCHAKCRVNKSAHTHNMIATRTHIPRNDQVISALICGQVTSVLVLGLAAGARASLHLRSASSQALHLRGGQDSDEAQEAKAKIAGANRSLSLFDRALKEAYKGLNRA